ncbi:MAG: amidohydrolase [Candidatus Rokubacteria bacterium]|nr:amidohydrolase [Candidatus Rokubacteria bacterium]
MTPEKATVFAWIDEHRARLSDWHLVIWHYAETAWREYRSAAFYVDLLRKEGFEVEAGTATMPTAFRARWGRGRPVLATYAEYDAVPGMSQASVPYRTPREGSHRWAPGHTDPHSALGIGALAGVLGAKAAMERHGLPGTLVLFGEPAEKVCGSKPIHAAHGYYDDLDAAISFHPTSLPALANTVVWDTHCGAYWSKIYTFECEAPETWGSAGTREGTNNPHTVARAPAALDAVCLMYTTTKYTKEAMLPHRGTWTLNEFVLVAGQATSDNLAPTVSQIQYAWRCPSLEMAGRIEAVLDQNARHVAALTHCTVREGWVSKTRVGLPNHAMAELTYRNLALAGPPAFPEAARAFARDIQRTLGLEPVADPFLPEIQELTPPEVGEARLRQALPPWQAHYTSDDYVEYTWHAPTARLYVGHAMLRPPTPGYRYPDWPRNALGGFPPAIDPLWYTAGRAIGAALVDLVTAPGELERAQAEFRERTGGGIGGARWVPPLLPPRFLAPILYRWPEYVTTVRGEEWWIPADPGAA